MLCLNRRCVDVLCPRLRRCSLSARKDPTKVASFISAAIVTFLNGQRSLLAVLLLMSLLLQQSLKLLVTPVQHDNRQLGFTLVSSVGKAAIGREIAQPLLEQPGTRPPQRLHRQRAGAKVAAAASSVAKRVTGRATAPTTWPKEVEVVERDDAQTVSMSLVSNAGKLGTMRVSVLLRPDLTINVQLA